MYRRREHFLFFGFFFLYAVQFYKKTLFFMKKKEIDSLTPIPTPSSQRPTSTQQSQYAQTHPTQAQPSAPAPPSSPHLHPVPTSTPQQPHAPPADYASPPQLASVHLPVVPRVPTTPQRQARSAPPQRHAQPHPPHCAQRSARGAMMAVRAAERGDPYRAAMQRRLAIHARVAPTHLQMRAACRSVTLGARRIGLCRGGALCVIGRAGLYVGVLGVVVLCCVC